jgi:hypothetical protein
MQREELRLKQEILKLISTLKGLHAMDDKVLHDHFSQYRESMSYTIHENISIEDDHMSNMFWNHIYTHFHKLKDLQECERKMMKQA